MLLIETIFGPTLDKRWRCVLVLAFVCSTPLALIMVVVGVAQGVVMGGFLAGAVVQVIVFTLAVQILRSVYRPSQGETASVGAPTQRRRPQLTLWQLALLALASFVVSASAWALIYPRFGLMVLTTIGITLLFREAWIRVKDESERSDLT